MSCDSLYSLVIYSITVEKFAAHFNCTPVDRASDSMMTLNFSWFGAELFLCCLVQRDSTDALLLLQISNKVVW